MKNFNKLLHLPLQLRRQGDNHLYQGVHWNIRCRFSHRTTSTDSRKNLSGHPPPARGAVKIGVKTDQSKVVFLRNDVLVRVVKVQVKSLHHFKNLRDVFRFQMEQ